MYKEFSLEFYCDIQDQHDNTFMNGVNVENFSNFDDIRDAHIIEFEIPLCYWGIPSIDVIYECLDLYEIY